MRDRITFKRNGKEKRFKEEERKEQRAKKKDAKKSGKQSYQEHKAQQ